jgi:hypothetical protein
VALILILGRVRLILIGLVGDLPWGSSAGGSDDDMQIYTAPLVTVRMFSQELFRAPPQRFRWG